MIPESPSQRAQRERREAFFGAAPLQGPSLPQQGSRIRESPAQRARREFKERFFEPKSPRPSSLKRTAEAFTTHDAPRIIQLPVTGGKTKNEAKADGVLIIQDCDGNEILRIPELAIDGEQVIRTGCEDSSSYPV